ncbi:hypothetical protein ACFFRE_09080 [Aciditerrimonas ferrireducens]|uniref:Glycosyltransferase RgtA/B/C/D-like domain-containing protein n=1 Tax=Aciditerrimonas ferrireducens TaxID=667306 RepID=A0ABV6C3M0_9ACTN
MTTVEGLREQRQAVVATAVLPGTEGRAQEAGGVGRRGQLAGVSAAHRAVVVVAALSLLGPAFAVWSGILTVPTLGVASAAVTVGSLASLVGATVVRTERGLRRVELLLLAVGLVALAAWAASAVAANPAYGTDEAAYEQYAASLLLRGVDPYGRSLLPALRLFQVPIQYATYTTSGGVVSSLGYPALPVLLIVPFIWLTGGVQSVQVANVTALAVAMVVAFFVLPRRYRTLAVLGVVGLPILFGYAVAGVNVILAVPFLVVVAWRFTETGVGGRLGRRGMVQAVCLGLAVSVQQIAWFVAPFVLVALWAARRREGLDRGDSARVLGRYAGIAAGTFFAVNAWFVAAGPLLWLKGVLGPLVQHAIPYGQGLIDLPVFAGVGGGNLSLYTFGAVALLGGLLACFGMFFGILWRAAFILPSLALFFPTRSLAEYWMTLVLVWVVAVFAAPPSAAFPRGVGAAVGGGWRRWRPVLAVLAFLPGAGLLGAAVASPSPLAMTVVSVRTNGQFQRVWELVVKVVNRSDVPLSPHFATNSIGQMTPFWHRLEGPAVLGPHRSARYLIAAPNVGSMPGITEPFQLDALTSRPETISVTRRITTEPYSAWIYQADVNRILPAGSAATLTVELRSPLGGLVRRAGVRIELGQIIYGQSQLIPAEASIDGAPEGQSPVERTTGPDGKATFRVVDSSPQGRPVYFQAWVVSKAGYPFGYSEIVDVLWSGK